MSRVPAFPLNGAGLRGTPVSFACGSGFLTTLSQRTKGEREWSGTTGALVLVS